MHADLYTKIILTIIAVCLTIIVLRDTQIIPVATAMTLEPDKTTKVQLMTSETEPLHVHLVNDSLGRTFEVKIRD